MNQKNQLLSIPSQTVEEMEGARRATGISSTVAPSYLSDIDPVPEPEVLERPIRRKFTADYKFKIVQEAASCNLPGQIGVLLRREGLYSSHLTYWRRQVREGTLKALSPKKRGPRKQKPNPLAQQVARLEKEKQRLSKKLKQAETIIEVQKKIPSYWRSPSTTTQGRNHEYYSFPVKTGRRSKCLRCSGRSAFQLLSLA